MSLRRTHPVWAIVGLVVALAGAGARAVAVGPRLTLPDAVERALHEGADARIARLEAEQADAAVGAARSIYWPQAAVTSNAGWSDRQDETINAVNGQGQVKRYPLSSLGSNEAWLSAYIEQTLFDLSRWHGVERSELEREAAAVQESAQRETISFAVTEQYVTLLRLQRLAALDAQRVQQAEWLDGQAATLLDAGRALPSEREQVALALEDARVQAASRGAELENARAAFWRAIGGDAGDAADVELAPESVPAVGVPANPPNDDTLRAVPELRILDLRRRMEEESLAAARAERFPTLSMRGGYFHYGTKRFDDFQTELAIGVDLHIPVFDGFKTSNTIEGASEALEAARLRYEMTRESKRERLKDLARQLAATQQQPELAERRVRLANERQRLADLALQAQRGTLPEALVARSDADRAGRAAVDAYFDRILVWANLKREAGGLAAALVGDRASASTDK
jgi:outer membrane protein TolC